MGAKSTEKARARSGALAEAGFGRRIVSPRRTISAPNQAPLRNPMAHATVPAILETTTITKYSFFPGFDLMNVGTARGPDKPATEPRTHPTVVRRNEINFRDKTGAGDEIRTHDPNLGKVVLYP